MKRNQNHVLIAVLGSTPQVLTETLYALCNVRKVPISEAWVISTQEGAQRVTAHLLSPSGGQFYKLQEDYPDTCGQVRFSRDHVIVAQDGLSPISDIRTRRHSEHFLELITQVIWEQSSCAHSALHCSISGGRKMLSTYLALALQLLGRPQDKLYHVLVNPKEIEHHPNFYYPPPQKKILALPDNKTVDTTKAQIDLIDIPFIRLRERVHIDRYISPTIGYRQLLEWVEHDLKQLLTLPELSIDYKHRLLHVGANHINLTPQRFCLYWYFADRSRQRPLDTESQNYSAYFEYPESPYFSHQMLEGLLERFDKLDQEGRMRYNFIKKVLDKQMLPMSWVLQNISRINQQIRLELPYPHEVPYYIISSEGRRGNKCYGIKLDGQKIVTPDSSSD